MSHKRPPYAKSALSLDDQIARLEQRGMLIPDKDEAREVLRHVSYYRLRGYWLWLEADTDSHAFKPGASWDQVMANYHFDEALRALIFEATCRFEISLRTCLAREFAHEHGPHGHLDRRSGKDASHFNRNLRGIVDQCDRAGREAFIAHFQQAYPEATPPIWAVMEVISFGLLQNMLQNLTPAALVRKVADHYGIKHVVLQSWARHLNTVRNQCAHHGRLWNRVYGGIQLRKPGRVADASLLAAWQDNCPKMYNTLLVLVYLTDQIASGEEARQYRARCALLLQSNPGAARDMGAPVRWDDAGFWREHQA